MRLWVYDSMREGTQTHGLESPSTVPYLPPPFPEVWPREVKRSSFIALDESKFTYFDLPFFGPDYLISHAVVLYPCPDLGLRPKAINVLDINPKRIETEKVYKKRAELKQEFRIVLADALTDEIKAYGLDSDAEFWACRFFSSSGPQWTDKNQRKRNLLKYIEEDHVVRYPDKLHMPFMDGVMDFHPCPILFAHNRAAEYVHETLPRLGSVFDSYKMKSGPDEVLAGIRSLDYQELNNGIKGRIFVSPLLINEMERYCASNA